MASPSKPILPILASLQIVDANGFATAAFQKVLLSLTNVIQGTSGILEVVTTTGPSSTTLQALSSQVQALMISVQTVQDSLYAIFPTADVDGLDYPAMKPDGCVDTIYLDCGVQISAGVGNPNGLIWGSVGDIRSRQDGGVGSTLYVKETGSNTNTGWTAK